MAQESTIFDKRLQQIPADITATIAKIDELKGRWLGGASLSPQVLGRLKRSVLVTSTGASTRIEGSQLSDKDVEKVMRGLHIKKFTERDTQEVKGYYELLTNILDTWKSTTFNESTIKHWHKELLKHVTKDQSHLGKYKQTENRVEMHDAATGETLAALFDTTPAYLTPKETQDLITWTNSALQTAQHHPLLIIGNFLVSFLKIHPFTDGNGRLSRLLANFLLLQSGYAYIPYVSHEKLVEDNKADYYIALRRSQQTIGTNAEDITPWLNFFLNLILLQSQTAVALLSDKETNKLLTSKQKTVLEYLERVDKASPGTISQATNIAQPTVRQALDKLMKLKKIERLGQGRSTSYKKV